MLTNTDYYRSIIIEKLKLENIYKKELVKCLKEIHEMKMKKEKMVKMINEYHSQLEDKKEYFEFKKNSFEKYKLEMTQKLGENNLLLKPHLTGEKLLEINKKRKSVLLISDNNFELNSKISLEMKKKEKEMQALIFDYENILLVNNQKIEECKNQIVKCEKEMKEKKSQAEKLKEQQITYFMDILNKGVDVRTDGLSWVVRSLMELNAYVDNTCFPRFLESNHREYLLSLCKKEIELSQLKIILSVLKSRQRKLRDSETHDSVENQLLHSKYSFASILFNNEENCNFTQTKQGFYSNSLSEKNCKLMENIIKKTGNSMKLNYEMRIEEYNVKI
jgi:hypothetical protein